jgi:ribosomal protein S2
MEFLESRNQFGEKQKNKKKKKVNFTFNVRGSIEMILAASKEVER